MGMDCAMSKKNLGLAQRQLCQEKAVGLYHDRAKVRVSVFPRIGRAEKRRPRIGLPFHVSAASRAARRSCSRGACPFRKSPFQSPFAANLVAARAERDREWPGAPSAPVKLRRPPTGIMNLRRAPIAILKLRRAPTAIMKPRRAAKKHS